MKKLKAFIVSFLMILSASTVNVSASDKEMRSSLDINSLQHGLA